MMKFLAYLACYCLYPFSFLFPRNKWKWAFGSFRGAFNDNAKYLFIHVSEQMPEIQSVWLSINRKTVREIREKGLRAHFILSPKGVWFALTSKYWFFNAYASDIMFCLSGGATLVNLWHGLPLKRIEFDIDSGPLADRYVKKTLKERFFHPEVFKRPDYVLSSSPMFAEVFARSFRVLPGRCLNFGYPRNEILTWEEEKRLGFIERYEPLTTQELIAETQRFERVFVYLPTWRDSQAYFDAKYFDFNALEAAMCEQNALFLLKPHPNTKIDAKLFDGLEHIMLIPNNNDIYPLLSYTDVLVTDYSSIMYDYLWMKGKEMVLYLYDYQEYERDRDFVWPFNEMTVGRKAYDFPTLLEMLQTPSNQLDGEEWGRLAEKCWGNGTSNACEQIVSFFQQS